MDLLQFLLLPKFFDELGELQRSEPLIQQLVLLSEKSVLILEFMGEFRKVVSSSSSHLCHLCGVGALIYSIECSVACVSGVGVDIQQLCNISRARVRIKPLRAM